MNTGPNHRLDHTEATAQSATPEPPLADYRQHYGLSEDPFRDDPEFTFFGGAGRRALLEQLQHLCQFSASLLAVLGKPGVGKSRMALELANSFQFEDEICLLSAEPGAGAQAVLGQMARQFALSVDDNPSVGRLLAGLRHFAQVTDEEDQLALTIIDDAHHLDEQTLGALISLLQGQDSTGRRLHIVLFADSDMVNRLDQFNMHDVLIHDFELSPLSLEEATDYLNFRLEMADYMGPELFSEAKVEPWWRAAEGRLPRLHQQARRFLLESVTPEPASAGRGRPPLPLVHMVVIAVLLGVLLMVFLYSGDSDEDADRQSVRLLQERPSETLSLSDTPANQTSEPAVPSPEARQGADQGAARPRTQEPAQEVTEPEEAAPQATQPSEPSSPPRAEEDAPDATEETAERPSTEDTAPEPAPASLPALPEDEQILLSWPSSAYTLQLLGASSRDSVDRFVSAQSNRSKLLVFESRRSGKPWFVVVTGRFADSARARAALEELPANQRKAGPWPRALSEIQQEIEQHRDL